VKKKYGKVRTTIFTIDTDGRTPTCISFYECSSTCVSDVQYRYDVPANTTQNDYFEYISHKEFYRKLRVIEAYLKVKIYIKKTW
jgi:hypothetical protein